MYDHPSLMLVLESACSPKHSTVSSWKVLGNRNGGLSYRICRNSVCDPLELKIAINPSADEILLGKIVLEDVVFFVNRTTNERELLTHLLQDELITESEYLELEAKNISTELIRSLYLKSLNKRVHHIEHYRLLFKALCNTGNEHIAQWVLEGLKTQLLKPSSFSAPRSSANAMNCRSDPAVRNNASQEISPCPSEPIENSVLITVNQNASPQFKSSETEDPAQPKANANNTSAANQIAPPGFNPPENEDQGEQIDGVSVNDPLLGPSKPSNNFQDSSPPIPKSVGGEDHSVDQIRRLSDASGIADQGQHNDVFVPTDTYTQNQHARYITLSEMEDFTSLDKVTRHPQKIWLSIGDPLDFPDLPDFYEIYLTINNSRGVRWENWLPKNGDKVLLLRLNETFTIPEIRHFLTIMSNVITIGIHNLNGEICRRNFKQQSMKTSIESYQSTADVSGAGYLTHRSKIIQLTIGAPTDKPNLPESDEIHLVICNSEGVWWENWFPINSDKVTSLKLNGTFSPSAIRHFLSVMNNLTTLCVDTMIGKLCNKTSEANS
ncbi:unnamed protein product [Allacma fusca]|uniref:Uncharacterized protein n=1 Tax=Allacma fusca TaxID=39272 RepID=A0A8J2J7B8_9HEXA|nr:unnamed protein product [Allacma fusca]